VNISIRLSLAILVVAIGEVYKYLLLVEAKEESETINSEYLSALAAASGINKAFDKIAPQIIAAKAQKFKAQRPSPLGLIAKRIKRVIPFGKKRSNVKPTEVNLHPLLNMKYASKITEDEYFQHLFTLEAKGNLDIGKTLIALIYTFNILLFLAIAALMLFTGASWEAIILSLILDFILIAIYEMRQ
jgi:hypothetical protein